MSVMGKRPIVKDLKKKTECFGSYRGSALDRKSPGGRDRKTTAILSHMLFRFYVFSLGTCESLRKLKMQLEWDFFPFLSSSSISISCPHLDDQSGRRQEQAMK
jgi:hypothetical protein